MAQFAYGLDVACLRVLAVDLIAESPPESTPPRSRNRKPGRRSRRHCRRAVSLGLSPSSPMLKEPSQDCASQLAALHERPKVEPMGVTTPERVDLALRDTMISPRNPPWA